MYTQFNYAEIFNKVMVKHSLPIRAKPLDFIVSENCILLAFSESGEALADQLFGTLFPLSSAGLYHHYTSYGGFQGIVSSGCVRLSNLHKRFKSGEFRTFCRDHGLDGYLHTGINGTEEGEYSSLMSDLFYISMVDANAIDSDLHWNLFADKHRGVRLTLEVSLADGYPNFRAVTYQQPNCLPPYKEVKEAFAAKGLNFINSGLSRMPAFYQRVNFNSQFEHRLLAKHIRGSGSEFPFTIQDDKGLIKYIESDLITHNHNWFNMKLVEVTVGNAGSIKNVSNYLKDYSKFPSLKVRTFSKRIEGET